MNSQEIKERYQQILEDYHSKKIDWKTFELRLLELKLMRSADESKEPDAAKTSDRPSPEMVRPHFSKTGRFQIETEPGTGRFITNSPTGIHQTARTSITSRQATSAHEASRFIRATGPIQPPRRGTRLSVGVRLGNDYRLQHCLAFGPCGETWMAEEISSGCFVVLKPIPPQIQNDPVAWREYLHAFRRIRSLNSSEICPVFRLAKDEILGFFSVSAYADAVPLDEYYSHYRRAFHGFPVAVLVRLLWPIAQALDSAHHRGIIHGNVTPANVLVGRRCGSVITDFFLPSFLRGKQPVSDPWTEDHASWRAPEVWMNGRAERRSDQYSLGVLAYQLIFGRRPFRGQDAEELREQILRDAPPDLEKLPEGLQHAFEKVLAKSPEDRFTSCLDFLAQLDQQGSQGISAVSEKNAPEAPRKSLWAVLFGISALPNSVAGITLEDLWPQEITDLVPETADSVQGKVVSFPYEKPPKGFGDATAAKTFQTTMITLSALAGASVLGGALYFALPRHVPEKIEPTPGNVRVEPTSNNSVASPPPAGSAVQRPTPQVPTPAPNIQKTIESMAATVEPEEVERLNALSQQGDVTAQRRLGEAYFYGKGIGRDRRRAVEYFEMGAAQEDVSSLYHLARCHELGLGGLQKSLIQAVKLYKTAAENGSEPAREALQRLNAREY